MTLRGLAFLPVLGILALTGCSLPNRGAIKAGGVSVMSPMEAGSPATLAKTDAGTTIALPAGSSVIVTKTAPVAAIAATKDAPAVKAEPAKEVTEIKPNGATEYHHAESTVKAETGTVDTSIRKHKIDAAESRILLYAAIAASIGAGLFVYIKYPTPAICCGVASIVFFLAWKLSDLPDWFYVIGVIAAAGGFFLWRGHEKGEAHAAQPPP